MKLIHGVETVTPKKAELYLNKNSINRPLREGRVEKYSADMASGTWTACTAPIVFYENGDIADGQHRLYAIVESGQAQEFMVVRNFPRDAALNIDTGLPRSFTDNYSLAGNEKIDTNIVGICRWAEWGTRDISRVPTNAELTEVLHKHMEAAKFADKHIRGRRLRRSNVGAAVVRAYYVEKDTERLQRFCEIYKTGFAESASDSAAIALRNHCLMLSDKSMRGDIVEVDTFRRAQHAIYSFMKGRALTILRPPSDEAYPIKGIVAPELIRKNAKKGSLKTVKLGLKAPTKIIKRGS